MSSFSAIVQYINKKVSITDVLDRECNISEEETYSNISCMFHSDNSPSMRVYHGKNEDGTDRGCYCFTCGKTWTPFNFIKDYRELSFKDTVKYFEDVYNIDFKDFREEDYEVTREDSLLYIAELVDDIKHTVKTKSPKLYKALEIAIRDAVMQGKDKRLFKIYERVCGQITEL